MAGWFHRVISSWDDHPIRGFHNNPVVGEQRIPSKHFDLSVFGVVVHSN